MDARQLSWLNAGVAAVGFVVALSWLYVDVHNVMALMSLLPWAAGVVVSRFFPLEPSRFSVNFNTYAAMSEDDRALNYQARFLAMASGMVVLSVVVQVQSGTQLPDISAWGIPHGLRTALIVMTTATMVTVYSLRPRWPWLLGATVVGAVVEGGVWWWLHRPPL